MHCVERVAWGERVALTLWFSLEPAAAEDGKVGEAVGLAGYGTVELWGCRAMGRISCVRVGVLGVATG